MLLFCSPRDVLSQRRYRPKVRHKRKTREKRSIARNETLINAQSLPHVFISAFFWSAATNETLKNLELPISLLSRRSIEASQHHLELHLTSYWSLTSSRCPSSRRGRTRASGCPSGSCRYPAQPWQSKLCGCFHVPCSNGGSALLPCGWLSLWCRSCYISCIFPAVDTGS